MVAARVQTWEAMLYDSVQLFAVALTELSPARDVRTASLSCAKPRPWPHGSSLSNYLQTVELLTKTQSLNEQDFFIRAMYEHSY